MKKNIYFICWVVSFIEIKNCIVIIFNEEFVGGIMGRNEDFVEAGYEVFVGVIREVGFVNDSGVVIGSRVV